MQKGMSKSGGGSKFRKINPILQKTISTMKDPKSGIIPALEILQVGYNEMKEHLNQTSSSSMPETTIVTEILDGLEAIEKCFKVDSIVEQDGTDTIEDKSTSNVNTKRRQLKKMAFEGGLSVTSLVPQKKVSSMFRTAIVDDGEYLNIMKSKPTKKANSLNNRELKTVIKQLQIPM